MLNSGKPQVTLMLFVDLFTKVYTINFIFTRDKKGFTNAKKGYKNTIG